MFSGQTILVTGGTGTFGRAFVREALRHDPRKLIVLSRDELKQSEMARDFPDPRLRFFIGDVRDKDRLYRAFDGVDVVIHAAAMKQVPACEYNPFEAVKTNVLGAQNVIDAAIDCGVRQVLAISSDKAVQPVNLYGMTKGCAEKMFCEANAYVGGKGTRFSVVRYGNVIGSRGSVIPLFRQQASEGLLTITDERMTRFWLTIEQGEAFVLSCLMMQAGGEVFVPKVPSMRVVDLAEAIAPGVPRKVIGIRRGEKLHEVLISEDEARNTVHFIDRYVIDSQSPWMGRRLMPDGFRYSSDGNDHWLTVEELRGLVG
jgi:UDP-N-acetylglucosamine 4,6-dehydratase/5-epimerase